MKFAADPVPCEAGECTMLPHSKKFRSINVSEGSFSPYGSAGHSEAALLALKLSLKSLGVAILLHSLNQGAVHPSKP
jgi:hypothetical protein